VLDENEHVTIDTPLDFQVLFAFQTEVGATMEELELLEDLKWTMRAWRGGDHRYLPVTVRDIWAMASDTDCFDEAMLHRSLGRLSPGELNMLQGIFRLFAPLTLNDVRISGHNTFLNGQRIGWTNTDMLLDVSHVVWTIFKLEGLSSSNMDTMLLDGLTAKLNNGAYCDQLWHTNPRHFTTETRQLALEFFGNLEQWVYQQAAAA